MHTAVGASTALSCLAAEPDAKGTRSAYGLLEVLGVQGLLEVLGVQGYVFAIPGWWILEVPLVLLGPTGVSRCRGLIKLGRGVPGWGGREEHSGAPAGLATSPTSPLGVTPQSTTTATKIGGGSEGQHPDDCIETKLTQMVLSLTKSSPGPFWSCMLSQGKLAVCFGLCLPTFCTPRTSNWLRQANLD